MSCCPSFLLGGAGAHMSIHGVVSNDKFIVQHLTDIYLGESTTHEDPRAYRIAKIFTLLHHARQSLDDYYENIPAVATPTTPADDFPIARPCFFPYPTKFKEYRAGGDAESGYTEFEYTDVPVADTDNVTFFAKVKSEPLGQDLAVKFVDRYGVEAHELLAKEGMAPRHLYCGSLDGEKDVRGNANCDTG